MKKRVITTPSFERKIKKLEKYRIYTISQFYAQVKDFFSDENNNKFKKHVIKTSHKETVFSIKLGYDLRTLYYIIDTSKEYIDYIFIDIGTHDEVY